MIRHIVMLNLIPDVKPSALQDVMTGLAGLVDTVPGFDSFEHGPNHDVESKTPDYPYGFICSFADLSALNAYAENPTHKMLGARLVAMCQGGGDGIMVMDLDT